MDTRFAVEDVFEDDGNVFQVDLTGAPPRVKLVATCPWRFSCDPVDGVAHRRLRKLEVAVELDARSPSYVTLPYKNIVDSVVRSADTPTTVLLLGATVESFNAPALYRDLMYEFRFEDAGDSACCVKHRGIDNSRAFGLTSSSVALCGAGGETTVRVTGGVPVSCNSKFPKVLFDVPVHKHNGHVDSEEESLILDLRRQGVCNNGVTGVDRSGAASFFFNGSSGSIAIADARSVGEMGIERRDDHYIIARHVLHAYVEATQKDHEQQGPSLCSVVSKDGIRIGVLPVHPGGLHALLTRKTPLKDIGEPIISQLAFWFLVVS